MQYDRLKRRDFMTLLGGAATAWPFAARAQQPRMPWVGLLAGSELGDPQLAAIRRGLNEAGYIEGRNVAIKYRSANGRFDRLPAMAAELAADGVDAIFASAPSAAAAAKAATATIPVVFVVGTDPVGLGLVSSLNRPGGNVTGITFVTTTLGAKRLDLLRQLVPTATVVGLLINPANPTSESQANDVQAATRAFGLELVIVNARSESEIESAFSSFAQDRVNAIVLGGDGFFLSRREQLVELAARHAIPVMYYLREYAAAGGLISYGTNISDAFRLGGLYLGRILKGEKPSELPVQQSVNYELVINLKTAKALGLAVPLTMQATADEIIETP